MNYYIHGKDQALLKLELDKILKDFSKEESESMTVYDGDDKNFSLEQVIADVNTISLFGAENKLVLVRNPRFLYGGKGKDDGFKMLEDYLKNPSPFSSLIFYWDERLFPVKAEKTVEDDEDKETEEDKNLKKSSKAYTDLLKKLCDYRDVKPLTHEAFVNVVTSDIRHMGIEMNQKALNTLLDYLVEDVSLWKKEAEKLQLYGNPITAEDIPHLISRPLEDRWYELTTAILSRNLARTLDVYQDLLDTKNYPGAMLVMLANKFRQLYQVAELSKTESDASIASLLQVSEKSLYYTKRDARSFGLRRISGLLNQLSELDQNVKDGKVDVQTGLELFFIEATR